MTILDPSLSLSLSLSPIQSLTHFSLPLSLSQGVLDRFSQIQPKLIFSVAAVIYNGKTHDHMEKLTSVVKGQSPSCLSLGPFSGRSLFSDL